MCSNMVLTFIVICIIVLCLYFVGKVLRAYFHSFSSISKVQDAFKPDDFKIFSKYKSFVIIGCSGSGKSTTAKMIAQRFSKIQSLHLDDLNWSPNWQMADKKTFKQRAERSMTQLKAKDSPFVIDGNYTFAHEIIWPNIDVAIYLDYDFWIIFYRIIMRTFCHVITRKVICNGNVEQISRIFTKDSMPYFVWHRYDRYKQKIPALIRRYPNVKVLTIKSPYHFNYWFKNLE